MKPALVASLIVASIACGESESPTSVSAPPATTGVFPSTGAMLSFALDLPSGRPPFPAVVIGHGSGEMTKDSGAFLVPFWRDLGFAVLRYDKRGVGQSTGTYRGVSAANSVTQVAELAGDMLAGLAYLQTRREIDPARIGLMGVSQAGWIMAGAAERSRDVRFFVNVVGSVVPTGRNIVWENLRDRPIEEAYAQFSTFEGPVGWDPQPSLRATQAPAIWLLAGDDRLVPTRVCLPIIEALKADGHRFSVHTYAGLGHELGGTSIYWADVAAWLTSEGLR
jgi:dienelactone hydrolase